MNVLYGAIEYICACAINRRSLRPFFVEKTFTNAPRSTKFAKVSSLESFLLYGIQLKNIIYYHINISACMHGHGWIMHSVYKKHPPIHTNFGI